MPRSKIEALVVEGRYDLLPDDHKYQAFADVSGGRSDGSAMAIGHREGETRIIDYIKYVKAPHNPFEVISEFATALRKYGIRRITSDAFGGEWVTEAWRKQGIKAIKSPLNASALYLELIPVIGAGQDALELPDHETLIDQLAGLERKTRSGGREIVDHARGSHDDAANCVAGVVQMLATKKVRRCGGGWDFVGRGSTNYEEKKQIGVFT